MAAQSPGADSAPIIPLHSPLLQRHKAYGRELCKTLLRYTTDAETQDVVAALEELALSISEDRHAPGLVAARYDLYRKFWLAPGGESDADRESSGGAA